MTTQIYLLRHGITTANKNDIFAGRSGEELHPEGREQIAAVGRRLLGAKIGRILCGPLPRTRQSAEILATLFGAEVETSAALDEIALPHWDGLSKTAIRQNFGQEYPTWLATPESFAVPGCETLAAVQARASQAVAKLFSEAAGQSTLVVSHLIVLRCLVLHYRQMPLSAFRSIKIANGTLIRLSLDPNGHTQVAVIE